MQLFYSPDISAGGFCTLDAEESRHAVRVMRLREGDDIHVTDGRGNLYRCTIVQADSGSCMVEAVSQLSTPDTHTSDLHLAVAPTKNPSRMEWLVEKAVEIGVGEITLLQCDHSERSFLKTDRLQKLAISAMKQSLHTTLPRINPAVPMKEWLRTLAGGTPAQCLIAHCEATGPRTPLATALKPGMDTVVLIGPEGDFSADEIALALEYGYQPVSLGPSRLRTETAALYAVAAFNIINEKKLNTGPSPKERGVDRIGHDK